MNAKDLRSRTTTAKLAKPTDIDPGLGPALINALKRLGEELRELRIVSERQTIVLEGLAQAMREQRELSVRSTRAIEESSFTAAGMTSAIRDMRLALNAANTASLEQSATTRRLIEVLEGLQMQRAAHKNGNHPDDHLSDEGPP